MNQLIALSNKHMATIICARASVLYTIARSYSSGPVPLSYYQTINDNGELTPVIFLHGLFGNKNNFKSVASLVTRTTGRPCYTVDLRNHGDSPHKSFDSAPVIEMAHDIAYFLSHQLKLNLHRPSCYLIGHSLGGRVALQFADIYRRACVKLVPVDVSPCSLSLPPTSISSMVQYTDCMQKVIEKCSSNSLLEARKEADQLMQEDIKEKFIRDFLLLNLALTDNGQGQSRLGWKFNIKVIGEMLRADTIRTINMQGNNETPVAFIYGGRSDYLTEQMKPEIISMFPQSEFYCIPDAGHYLHVEKRKEFLATLFPLIQ